MNPSLAVRVKDEVELGEGKIAPRVKDDAVADLKNDLELVQFVPLVFRPVPLSSYLQSL